MDEYYRILESLPPALRTPLAKLDAHYAPHIQEIRLRLGQPVQFTICGRLCPAAKFLPGSGLPAALETDTLRDCFLQLCRRSVYAYEDELKQGYFTVQGGCRIGVAGCRGPGGFSAVTSVSYTHLRAHETDSYLVCRLLLEKKKNASHKGAVGQDGWKNL